jgi:dienelactone hydrolase
MFNPYQYQSGNHADVQLVNKNSLWTHQSVRFNNTLKTQYIGENQLIGEYLFPSGYQRAPLAILVHGMGDKSVLPCRLIARDLAKRGVASFILYLVFHTRRVPDSIKDRYPRLTTEEWFESYQLSVTDIHQVVDWAVQRPEIDKTQISLMGISYGSFVTSIAMALDRRINRAVLVESGANSDKITRHSFLLHRQYHLDDDTFNSSQQQYMDYLAEVEAKGWENVSAPKNSYLTDPLTFSYLLKGRSLLMINASLDEMIPRVATLELRRYLGDPLQDRRAKFSTGVILCGGSAPPPLR